MKLDEQSLIPLYQQVMDDIKARIESGGYPTGSRIPSEGELSEVYQVSRITIRRAITELSKAGLLTKKQGKGTYVNHPITVHKIVQRVDIRKFDQSCREAGRTPGMTLASARHAAGNSMVCDALRIPRGADVLTVIRIHTADNDRVLIECDYLDGERFDFLTKHDLNHEYILDIVEQHGIVAETLKTRELEMERAEAEIASYLQVRIGEPLFRLDLCYYDAEDHPIVATRLHLLGTDFSFEVL